jgi:hypothetical protein
MTRAVALVPLLVLVSAGPAAWGQPGSKASAAASQRERMTTCNTAASARTLKGQARQTFMSACLSGKSNQTTLMKVCNAQATQDKLTADARKSYVSSCLKSSS